MLTEKQNKCSRAACNKEAQGWFDKEKTKEYCKSCADLLNHSMKDAIEEGLIELPIQKHKTSEQWWNEVKNNEILFTEWLKKQYHGELSAAYRISALWNKIGGGTYQEDKIIDTIIKQEETHAEWIKSLLISRNIKAEYLIDHKARYWDIALKDITNIQELAAIAAHAEEMRLERIKTICADEDAPEDVSEVFQKILKDEEFHAQAFKEITTTEEYEKRKENHKAGAEAIGLVL